MKKVSVIYYIIITIIFAVMAWLNCIPINPFLTEGLLFIVAYCFFISLGILFSGRSIGVSFQLGTGINLDIDSTRIKIAILVTAIPVVFMLGMSLLGTPLFNADAYQKQLGEPEVKEFTSDIQAIDVNQIPIVDLALASNLAEKKLGEKPALGSQVHLGEPTIQNVNNKLVWVVPLEHSGFFKWLNNLKGTPGYIIVSATDPKEVTYVDKYLVKYQPSSYFAQDLQRHVRFGKDIASGLTDFSFELDDQGQPYWVVSTYKNTRFFSLPEATGVIVVNATTGEQNKYTIENVPEWVDRIQPRSFIANQITNQGEYIHGIFNFSNKDKYKTSDGSAVVYNKGKCYMFTGLTSVGSDEAAMGFVMVDLKTKESIRYQLSGATEVAAQKSAEGKVQNLRYTATFPLVTNVNGIPTYFMSLKDKEGLIKQYAFVSIKDYTSVGTGETIQDAMRNYEQVTRSSNNGGITGTSNVKEMVGVVDRIAAEQISNMTIYKIVLKEQPNKIYTCSYDISEELALTKPEDKVKIQFYDTDKAIINATTFDNLLYEQK